MDRWDGKAFNDSGSRKTYQASARWPAFAEGERWVSQLPSHEEKEDFSMMKCMIGLILFLPMFGAISADEEGQASAKIEEKIEVVGKVSLGRTLQSVSIYLEEEFKGFKFESLKSLFNLTPGILVLNSGNPGQFAYSYARGASVNQMLYLVNGIKLFDPANAMGGNYSFLSPELVEKVEIVRGPMSNRYGSSAMGGVVNIITKKTGTSASVSGGSHGTYEGSLHFSENFGTMAFVFERILARL